MKRLAGVAAIAWVMGCNAKRADREAPVKQVDRQPTPAGGSGVPDTKGDRGGGIELFLDGELEAVGAIDKDLVRKVVKDNATKLQVCYEQTLMANPEIAGTVTASFTIDNGSVTNIKATGVHPDVEACVVKAVQLFKFPPGGKVEVTYPFTFKPAS